MTQPIDPSRLVFVAGLHRSGTTALAAALAEHPDVSGLTDTGVIEDEGQFLQEVYPTDEWYGGAGFFAWDLDSHLTEASELATPENAQRMVEAWAPSWDLSRRLLVEKSPSNLVKGRFLQAVFPGSALVVVLRHPIVVALGTRKWHKRSRLRTMVEHNLRAYGVFFSDLPHLERVHVIRYEDLIARPEEVLTGVADHLGLDGSIPHTSIQGGRSTTYEETWRSLARGNPWQRYQRRRIRHETRDRLAQLGYDADDLGTVLPWDVDAVVPWGTPVSPYSRYAAKLSGRFRGVRDPDRRRHPAES